MSGDVTVPKFASFKPKKENNGLGESVASKTAQSHDLGRASPNNKEDSHGNKRRKDHRSQEDSQHRHRHHRHRRSRSEERRVVKDIDPKPDDSFPPPILYDDRIFVIDTTGDDKNLIYGSIHRYSIPKYRRYGNGSVLGCPKYMKIDRDLSDEKGIVLSDDHNRFPAKREKYVWAKRAKGPERLVKLRPEVQGSNADLNADFLSLSTGKKRKRVEADDGFLSEDDHQHYRSIEGKARERADPLDQDFQYATDSSGSELEGGLELDLDSVTKARSSELSRRVEKQPQDLEAWLDLIDHQDKLLGLSKNGLRKVTQAERKSTAEIKIHIYEKALRLMRSSSSLERLSIGLMEEGAKVWDIEKQSGRWEDMTKAYPHSVALWKKYIDFMQTNFATFNYDEHRKLFTQRIDLLRSLILQGNHSDLQESVVYTLIRATVFMREAGYQELALAIWQGFLEYNLFRPLNPVSAPSGMTELFKDFWESEVPRIGEDRAKGWRIYVQDSSSSSVPNPRNDNEVPEISMSDHKLTFEKWVVAERQRSEESREPSRTMDNVTENDPYRVILFDDIEPFLVQLPEDMNSRNLIFNAFLAFCHLPQTPISGPYYRSKEWREDSFIRTEVLNYDKVLLQDFLSSDEQSEASWISSRFLFHNFVNSSDTLFAGGKWFMSLQPWTSIYGKDSAPIKYHWVQNALQLLSTISTQFAEYFLASSFVNEPQNIKKTAKNLLKTYSSNIALYNAYAIIEWRRGNKDAARNVFSTAMGMSASMPDVEGNGSFLLRKSLVWLLLQDGNPSEAFQTLLGAPEVSPAAILKTRQELTAVRDYSVSAALISAAVTQTELLAILEYYTASLGTRLQGDIVAALSIFDTFSEVLSNRGLGASSDNELLHQSAARLLYLHANSGPYRPGFIREKLTHSLTLFPQNTLIFSLFAWNESRLQMDRRVRSILLSTIHTPGTVMSHIFAIRHEILHGNVHSQHAAFEKALSGESESKFNPGIWRLYLLWCLRAKKFEGKVKDVFSRGVVACPWAKGFMMLAFEELSGKMEVEELKGVYKVLVEKELRIHIDLDELMEE